MRMHILGHRGGHCVAFALLPTSLLPTPLHTWHVPRDEYWLLPKVDPWSSPIRYHSACAGVHGGFYEVGHQQNEDLQEGKEGAVIQRLRGTLLALPHIVHSVILSFCHSVILIALPHTVHSVILSLCHSHCAATHSALKNTQRGTSRIRTCNTNIRLHEVVPLKVV